MKAFYILIAFAICCNTTIAQFNPANNIYDTGGLTYHQKNSSGLGLDTASAACSTSNSFWGTDVSTSELKEFDITGNVITYTGNSIATCPGYSLAISNNLNGGVVSPTFYTSTGNQVFYWDGASNWITGPPAPGYLPNATGYGNLVYFLDNSTTPSNITKYDGINYTLFFSINKYSGLADLACDAIGNVYMLTRNTSGTLMSDSIVVINPAGQIIQQYPFVVDMIHGYGCFISGNTLYLGFGASNPTLGNKILPVTFSAGAATAGTPIPLPSGISIHNDLASCTPGTPLNVGNVAKEIDFSLLPNLAENSISIIVNQFADVTYTIYDAAGRIIITPAKLLSTKSSVDISALPKGVYFLELKQNGKTERKKFVKI